MEITIKNSQRQVRISSLKIEKALRRALKYLKRNNRLPADLSSIEISILFVSDRKMRELNKCYRNFDKTTDVLSFPQIFEGHGSWVMGHGETKPCPISLGDIVISPEQAERQAEEHGFTFYKEITWLLIHGLLHLLGYDHEKNRYQARKMRRLETELLEHLCV